MFGPAAKDKLRTIGEQRWETMAPSDQEEISSKNLERLAHWRAKKDYCAVGNLGEQIAGRLLVTMNYHLLAAQDDLVGMVQDVLGMATRANPEDFVAIDPKGRLVTINSKATISPGTCRILKSGDLSRPKLARGQETVPYSTQRASLITPLNGESFSQVVKVDLLHRKAQVFEILDSGKLVALNPPREVAHLLQKVLSEFPGRMPPPSVSDLS